ncbi:XrtA system polysaccharide deacetylase [Oryzomonas sagensis]|uniref:XrtA system polysaccharide deacetylase n=1 Tax=Oryzomonas sagensis TaxID=2603857 RepID=UPI001FE6F5C7|nr:XrtA system polysaccharide deacetylase [Oryzomonas sagensis]
MILNVLTIDVEDYFQVSAFERCVKRSEWGAYPLRVEDNTRRILDMLDEFGVTATFFVLGWIAERTPRLVKEIQARRHEIACHGYGHQRVTQQTRQEFRDDIRKSKAVLENLLGTAVIGYRAPSYSIARNSFWAFDELIEAGYLYDSSVFPIRHDFYGIPDWPRYACNVLRKANGDWDPETEAPETGGAEIGAAPRIFEIPITTVNICGKNIPIAGGGYFRFFPYAFTKWGLQRINSKENKSFVFYLHPWELDPEQPRMRGAGVKSTFRHYLNLHKTAQRFHQLLGDFSFTSLKRMYFDDGSMRS